jgi:hypothetical protein
MILGPLEFTCVLLIQGNIIMGLWLEISKYKRKYRIKMVTQKSLYPEQQR